MTQAAAPAQTRPPLKHTQIGRVVSDKRDKTRRVIVTFLAKAPKYGKYVRGRTSYQVHDPANQSKTGDRVEIAPCRPISKTKSWRLVRIVESGPGPEPAPGGEPS